MKLLDFFQEENPRHILVPRWKLCLLMLLIGFFETAVLLCFNGTLIILSVFLFFPTIYLWGFGWGIWKQYYAPVWYPVCLFLVSAVAVAIRILLYNVC